MAAALFLIAGGGIYFLFFTENLKIKNITVNGLETLEQDVVLAEINKQFDEKSFSYLETKKNIIFFDAEMLEADLLSTSPVLKKVQVEKRFPHELFINVVERKAHGIWCSADECRYFDDEKQTWGSAGRSSGFLFLTIEDKRKKDNFNIDGDFFEAINQVALNLSKLTIKSVEIPEDSFDEFKVYTDKSFYLVFSLESDIKEQLKILEIFLEERFLKDPNFSPQYLDLRIDGRIYLK